MTYVIRATVSGGRTGYHSALLKEDGAILQFATEEDAIAVARDYTIHMNGPNARASFSYTVERA